VRLPKGRFRLEIEAPLKIPRKPNGNIDTAQLTQDVNDCVARWVREYPEQWLWLHKRWRPDVMEKLAAAKAQKQAKKNARQ
jgi:KDO2-lipid IV(A) lauroyltransferase